MTALTDPADHSVAELKDELDAVEDVETLERLLEAERTGEERVTAIDAIAGRLDEVATETDEDPADVADPDGGDASDATDGADVTDGAAEEAETAADAEPTSDAQPIPDGETADDDVADGSASPKNGAAVVEEGWSKDTVVGLGRPSGEETAAAANGDDASESPRGDRPSEDASRTEREPRAERGVRPSENGNAAVDLPDRSSKRAEAASLSATVPGADEDVGERLLENIERIRHTFEHSTSESGRMDARIRQLQTEVGDLKAYTNALEEFLD
jgi:hypothetical protein